MCKLIDSDLLKLLNAHKKALNAGYSYSQSVAHLPKQMVDSVKQELQERLNNFFWCQFVCVCVCVCVCCGNNVSYV